MEAYAKGIALRVSWVDSTQRSGWMYEENPPVVVEDIITQGFFINSTKVGMNISSTMSEGGGILSLVTIPWEAIKNVQIIEEWSRDDRPGEG